MHITSRTFPGVPASVSTARRFVSEALSAWGAEDAEWTVSHLVSELTTNAVLHAHTEFDVELSLDQELLVIRVSDRSAQPPVLRQFGPQATTGRGMSMIAQLSRTWGVDVASGGKTVWCSIDTSETADVFDLTAVLGADLDDDLADPSAGGTERNSATSGQEARAA